MKLALIGLLLFLSSISFGETLRDAKKSYAKKQYKKTERIIRKIVTENPKDLDNRQFATNYGFWEGKTLTGKANANKGYLYSPSGSEYQYFFYNKLINNKLIGEASYTDGSLYSKNNYLLEYYHNYNKRNWFSINYQYENRQYATGNQKSDLLGLGLITFLEDWDKHLMLASGFQASINKGFFPNYSLDNELFYFQGNNTYSFDLKFSIYDNDTLVTFLSPHYRRDFSNSTYLGIRPYLVLSKGTNVLFWKVYGGYIWNYKHSGEAGLSYGEDKEDGLNQEHFISYDLKYKYNFSHQFELSLKYNHFENFKNRIENTYFVNLLWKY